MKIQKEDNKIKKRKALYKEERILTLHGGFEFIMLKSNQPIVPSLHGTFKIFMLMYSFQLLEVLNFKCCSR